MKIPAKGAPGLTLEEMKQFVRDHFEEFVNQKKSEVAFKNFSTDFLDHDEPTGVEVGPEAAKKMMETAYKRWPDLKVAIEDILAEEDKVVIRNSWTGREAATGKGLNSMGSSCGALRIRRLSSAGQPSRLPLLSAQEPRNGMISWRNQRNSHGKRGRDRKSTRLNSSHGYISY